jgi:hypothetical protein
MGFLKTLFGLDREEKQTEQKEEQYHCIRFMTERGEQIGMFLTQEELERGVSRWVEQIKTMPIQETDSNEEGVL